MLRGILQVTALVLAGPLVVLTVVAWMRLRSASSRKERRDTVIVASICSYFAFATSAMAISGEVIAWQWGAVVVCMGLVGGALLGRDVFRNS